MAAPVPTITVNFVIPMLAQLVQSNVDLRREVSDLRAQLSTRLDTIESRLPQQANRLSLAVNSQDLDHDPTSVHEDRHIGESHHVDQDHDVQSNNSVNQDIHAPDDYEDDLAQDQNLANEHDLAPEHDSAHDSSSSVDEGITMVNPTSPLPVHGKKRKRTVRSAVKSASGKSPYINHSGFVVRSSDTQLAQRRHEKPGSSRSESPFDSNIDVHESSDRLEMIPPVRPQSRAPALPQKIRPQRTKTVMGDTDETPTQVSAEITMRCAHFLAKYVQC